MREREVGEWWRGEGRVWMWLSWVGEVEEVFEGGDADGLSLAGRPGIANC